MRDCNSFSRPLALHSDTLNFEKKNKQHSHVYINNEMKLRTYYSHLKCTYYFWNYRQFHCSRGKNRFTTGKQCTRNGWKKKRIENRFYTFLHKCLMCTDMIRGSESWEGVRARARARERKSWKSLPDKEFKVFKWSGEVEEQWANNMI